MKSGNSSVIAVLGSIVLVLAFVSPPLLASNECTCNYSGSAKGGGTTACRVSRICATNQEASCSCTSSGCSSSCTTNLNQGFLAPSLPEETLTLLELNETTLAGMCEWVEHLDAHWGCSIEGGLLEETRPLTRLYEGTESFPETIERVARDYGACAELDSRHRIVRFRPSGHCLERAHPPIEREE